MFLHFLARYCFINIIPNGFNYQACRACLVSWILTLTTSNCDSQAGFGWRFHTAGTLITVYEWRLHPHKHWARQCTKHQEDTGSLDHPELWEALTQEIRRRRLAPAERGWVTCNGGRGQGSEDKHETHGVDSHCRMTGLVGAPLATFPRHQPAFIAGQRGHWEAHRAGSSFACFDCASYTTPFFLS